MRSLLANKRRIASMLPASLRTGTVSCGDVKGIEHAIEATADLLYEAVAQGLNARFVETIASVINWRRSDDCHGGGQATWS